MTWTLFTSDVPEAVVTDFRSRLVILVRKQWIYFGRHVFTNLHEAATQHQA